MGVMNISYAGSRVSAAEDRLLGDASQQLRDCVAGVCLGFDLLGVGGGDFRQAAWEFFASCHFGWAADRGGVARLTLNRSGAAATGPRL